VLPKFFPNIWLPTQPTRSKRNYDPTQSSQRMDSTHVCVRCTHQSNHEERSLIVSSVLLLAFFGQSGSKQHEELDQQETIGMNMLQGINATYVYV